MALALSLVAVLMLVAKVFAASGSTNSSLGGSTDLDLWTMGMGLLGGLALFLFGMEQMADALKALAADRLKDILARLTTNRFMGAITGAIVTAIWGYPFNRSYHMFSAWRILALASTTRARLASFKPGFEPMRTAWTTSNGCGGPTASSVRVAATKAVGAWAMAASCVRRVRHAVR